MNWGSERGKSGLAKMLMREHGLSKRVAEKGVNAVFDRMARALRRGEEVELPVGRIQAVGPPRGQKKQFIQGFRNIQNQEKFYRIVKYPERIIRFRPDPKLVRRGLAALPSPPPASPERERKQEELERLFVQLMGRKISAQELPQLLAASVDPNKTCADADLPGYLDRLLARLRLLVREQRQYTNFLFLRDRVSEVNWIR